jgi:hypothetical protein
MGGGDRLLGVNGQKRCQRWSFWRAWDAVLIEGRCKHSIRDPGCVCVGGAEEGKELSRVKESGPFA